MDSREQQIRRSVWQLASQWLTRTLAVTCLMVAPGLVGAYLDRRWEKSFLSPLGFGLGLIMGTVGLIVLARRLTPPAGGKPLIDEPVDVATAEIDEASK